MEVKELVSYYVNYNSETLSVNFRLIEDSDDEIRIDEIPLDKVKSFGYNIIKNNSDSFNPSDEDYDEDEFEEDEIDEDEVIMFINEYYQINSDELPPSELY